MAKSTEEANYERRAIHYAGLALTGLLASPDDIILDLSQTNRSQRLTRSIDESLYATAAFDIGEAMVREELKRFGN